MKTEIESHPPRAQKAEKEVTLVHARNKKKLDTRTERKRGGGNSNKDTASENDMGEVTNNAWVELLLLLLTDTGSGRARRELSSSSPSSAALFGDIGLFWAHVSRMMMHRCCLSGLLFCSRELRRQFWVGLLMVFFLEGVKTAPVVRCSKWSAY